MGGQHEYDADLDQLIRNGEALIAEAKELAKAADAAIESSELLAVEARLVRADIARRRAAERPATEWRVREDGRAEITTPPDGV